MNERSLAPPASSVNTRRRLRASDNNLFLTRTGSFRTALNRSLLRPSNEIVRCHSCALRSLYMWTLERRARLGPLRYQRMQLSWWLVRMERAGCDGCNLHAAAFSCPLADDPFVSTNFIDSTSLRSRNLGEIRKGAALRCLAPVSLGHREPWVTFSFGKDCW